MVLRFTKVDALLDSNRKIRKGGRNAREVYLFALRRHHALDRNDGRLPLVELEAWYVADQLMMSEDEAQEGLDRAVLVNLLAVDGPMVVIVGWGDDWSKGPMNEADRKRLQRERTRESPKPAETHTPCPDSVRTCPDTIVTVRTGHECHALDETRLDETREREAPSEPAPPAPDVAPLRLTPDSPAPKASRARPRTNQPPADWMPPVGWLDEDGKWSLVARSPEWFNASGELERFRDNHAKRGELIADWAAAWRTWVRNAIRFHGERAGPPSRGFHGQPDRNTEIRILKRL